MELSHTEAAGQVLVAGFSGPEAPAALVDAAARGALGGVILFKRNLTTPDRVPDTLRPLIEAAPKDAPLMTAIDQEGGRVARLGAPILTLPPMRRLGEIDDPALTERAGRVLGRQLAALGLSCDFAPILDVDTNPDNPVIGDRSFGRTPEIVTRHALAFARGLAAAPILSCGKHFPGHGDTELDSHLALPRLRHDRTRLDAVELAPFRAAAKAIPTLMTAHVIFDALDPDVPATLSRRVITELLRGELGYEGLIISDDLEMKAVSVGWGVVEAALSAIDAGCDTLLVCSDLDALAATRAALEKRADEDPAFGARLMNAAKRSIAVRRTCPPRIDPGRLDDPEARRLEEEIAERLDQGGPG
jgi:beta-N-acetylhexosaminidase